MSSPPSRFRHRTARGATTATAYDRAGRPVERVAAADSQAVHWTETYHAAVLNNGRSDLPQTLTYRAGASAATPVAMTRTLGVDWFGREYDRIFDIPEVRTAEVLTTNYGTNGLVSGVWRESTNPTGMDDDDSAATYEYNARGQVTKLTTWLGSASNSIENKYDQYGNPPHHNEAQATANSLYRPSRFGKYIATYDDEGNVGVLQWVEPGANDNRDHRVEFEYDHRDRLAKVTVMADPDLQDVGLITTYEIAYQYDAHDQLVERAITYKKGVNPAFANFPALDQLRTLANVAYSKSETGTYTNEVVDGLLLLDTLTAIPANTTHVERYAYDRGHEYADLKWNEATETNDLLRRYVRGPQDELFARLDSSSTMLYLTDRQGSVLQIVTPSGGIAKKIRYADTRTLWRAGLNFDRMEFAGRPIDFITEATLLNGRWLSGLTGRFLTEDGSLGGLDPYPFAGGSAPNAPRDLFEKTFWDRDSVQATERVLTGIYGAVRKAPWEMYATVRDTLHTGLSAATQISDWAVGGIGYSHGVYVVDFKSGMYKGYDESVKAGETASAWGRAVGGALTLNVSEAGITLNDWAHGRATAEQFGESLGGVGLSALGLKGLGKLATQLRQSTAGLGTRAATLSVLKQVGGLALDTALQVVVRAGLGLGRAGLGLTGQGLGAAVRSALRTGNKGERTNALARLVHNADGTHNTGFVGRQASRLAEWTGTKACFVAGSPIEGRYGAKPIEEYRSYEEHGDDCDWVVSRSEFNDDGPLVLRRVLRKFERLAVVVEVTVGGKVIGTTGEHPVFVRGRGWSNANELQVGDEVRLMAPGWRKVESMAVTDRVEPVYNLEIEEDHTYFVGCDEWGFSVWAHNAEYTQFAKGAVAGPSGTRSSLRYLLGKWDKGTFTRIIDSIKYHTIKHGGGLTAVEYTQQALAAFAHSAARKEIVPGRTGSPHAKVIKLKSPLGNGTFTMNGKVLTFSPVHH